MANPIPDVSVIAPVFDRAPMTARAIRSLQAQTLSNIEIIIVDDGSTDGTSEIVAGSKNRGSG